MNTPTHESNQSSFTKEGRELAKKALGEAYRYNKVTVTCPKCGSIVNVWKTDDGGRTYVSCDCRYVHTVEINL